ncbi:Catabolic L-serine/threonine dehydratase [Dirofilaria immitis]
MIFFCCPIHHLLNFHPPKCSLPVHFEERTNNCQSFLFHILAAIGIERCGHPTKSSLKRRTFSLARQFKQRYLLCQIRDHLEDCSEFTKQLYLEFAVLCFLKLFLNMNIVL